MFVGVCGCWLLSFGGVVVWLCAVVVRVSVVEVSVVVLLFWCICWVLLYMSVVHVFGAV